MLGLGIGIAALGVGIGLGLIGYGALQGMSRQPEAIGRLQVAMLIALAFVELVFLLTVFVAPGSVGTVEKDVARIQAGGAAGAGTTGG
jgi:F-type H+-transporting ATPase subunit c